MTPASIAQRRDWLSVLARAPRGELQQRAAAALEGLAFETLRPAETGLVMLRGRIGNRGDRFNVGEATLTRCVMRHRAPEGTTAGVGYVLGRDTERAGWVAQLDALLQQPARHALLMRDVVEPLRAAAQAAEAAARSRTAASRVRFFTLESEVA